MYSRDNGNNNLSDFIRSEKTPANDDYTLAEETLADDDYTLAEETLVEDDYTLAEEPAADADYTLTEEPEEYSHPTGYSQEELDALGSTIEEVEECKTTFYFGNRGKLYVRMAQIYEAEGDLAQAYMNYNLAVNLHGLTDYAQKRDELRSQFSPEGLRRILRNMNRGEQA